MDRIEYEAAAHAAITRRLPFQHEGEWYTTLEEVLDTFEPVRPAEAYEEAHTEALATEAARQAKADAIAERRAARAAQRAADDKWYREALAEYEEERDWWEKEYAADPATPAEQDLAHDLYAGDFLQGIRLQCPIHPGHLEPGARQYETVPTRPPGWLIREELDARSARLFGDGQSVDGPGCSLAVGEVQGGKEITHLFYSGVMNSVFGDRSSGKTWMALALAREFIERGEHVVWLNFEAMLGSSLKARLHAMGVEQGKVITYFHAYDRPDEAPAADREVGLVVIDAVDPCLSHMGKNTTNDSSAIDAMAKQYFYPYQATNPTVTGLTIDHVGNGNDKREAGSRRKQHYTQGVKYQLVSQEVSRKGTRGFAALLLRKDNNGEIPFNEGEDVAYVSLDSTHDVDAIAVRITAQAPLKANESVTEQTQRKSARRDALRFIREAGGVIERLDFNSKMTAAGHSLGNARTQLSALKKDELIAVDDEGVISLISAD
ncbi:hypothetical protein ACFXPT_10940 [Streptomyces goshikiensis]|uniref:hypothetical protein n=1 Tax=Streptomyces goshikiensis TaxID=1942 RepID=UPI0036C20E92